MLVQIAGVIPLVLRQPASTLLATGLSGSGNFSRKAEQVPSLAFRLFGAFISAVMILTLTPLSANANGAAGRTPLASTASVTTGPAVATTPVKMTRIKIIFDNCKACTIGVQRWISGASLASNNRASRVLAHAITHKLRPGVFAIYVPSKYTRGLSFPAGASWRDNSDATANFGYRVNVVTRFVGVPAGQLVSDRRAMSARGFGCWGGTSRNRVTFHVRIHRFRARDPFTHAVGWNFKAWINPGVRAYGPTAKYPGNQDTWVC